MKICFVGAGALGCAMGGVLTEAGADVTLIDRGRAHVDALNRQGLRLRRDGIDRTVEVKAVPDCNGLPRADLVIVLCKSFDTREAIEAAAPILGGDTMVMSLQNGLGHEDILASVVGRERVLAGKTYVGGVRLGPGHVIEGTRGKATYIGELDGRLSERANHVAAVFNEAGLVTHVSANIVGMMWDKLLVNVATGALSGITRLPYGGLYNVPAIEACAVAAVAEAIAVAGAKDVALSSTDPRDAWLKAAEGLPPEFKASMLQSLENGSRTEIDFINGAVVHWGERCGVPTPVNQALVAAIKGIEHHMAHYRTDR